MEASDARRLKALEEENRKRKKLLAEQVMDNATLKELLGKKRLTPAARRAAVSWAVEIKDYGQRRACELIGTAPRVYRYRSRRPDDGALRLRLKALAASRRRFVYRGLHLLLRREGEVLNHKRLFRICREERLASASVAAASGRSARAPIGLPQGASQLVSGLRVRQSRRRPPCWRLSTTSRASAWLLLPAPRSAAPA